MKVYIDNEDITNEIKEIDQEKIISIVQSKLSDSIINQIKMDDKILNLQYFQDNILDLNNVDYIKFISKKTDDLVKETLNEAQNYLPKLKEGVQEIARLIRRRENQLVGNKLMLAIEGFQWYTEVIDSISSLINNETLKKKIKDELNQFNEIFNKALQKQKNDEYDKLADMLYGDITYRIEGFISLNDNLLEDIQK